MTNLPPPTTTNTPASQASNDAPAPLTEYAVLVALEEGWKRLPGVVSARSAEHAIRGAAGNTPGTYVAVPSRSWKPVKVGVVTVPTVKLEDA